MRAVFEKSSQHIQRITTYEVKPAGSNQQSAFSIQWTKMEAEVRTAPERRMRATKLLSTYSVHRATIPRGLVPPEGADPMLVKAPVVVLMLKMEMLFELKFDV